MGPFYRIGVFYSFLLEFGLLPFHYLNGWSVSIIWFAFGVGPRIAASLLGILSIILIVQSVSAKSKAVPAVSQKEKPEGSAESRKRVFLTFLLILLYLALLESVGFLITTAFYLFFQILVLSRKKPNLPLYGLIAVSTSIIVYYLFVKVFISFSCRDPWIGV
jgi:Na+/melibiose symporter-like transporter